MSCSSSANPTYWTHNIGGNPSFQTFSESYFNNQFGAILLGALGGDCVAAKEYAEANMGSFLFFVIKDGTYISGPSTWDLVDGQGLLITLNGVILGNASKSGGVITDTTGISWPWLITGDMEIQWGQGGSGGAGIKNITTLQTIDTNAWWCCASGCTNCTPPVSTIPIPPSFGIPAKPMEDRDPVEYNQSVPIIQTPLYFSNFTWQVVPAMGQVKSNG